MDPLLSETLEYYRKVDSVYRSSGYRDSYELNAFWADENMKNMIEVLNGSASAIEAVHSIQKTWLFSVNTSEEVKSDAVDWLLAEQRGREIDIFSFDSSIRESDFSCPDNNVSRGGRILTPDFLRTVNIVCEIEKFCQPGKSRFSVFELGGGCGHLARTLKLFMPGCSYVIVDIPETLCFSHMFLRLNFPESSSLFVTDESQLHGLSVGDFDFVFVPTKFAEGILENEFDLFVNTASLGEMKNSVIRYWMDFIQNRLKVKYLFSLNRYLNTIKTDGTMDWRLEENECSVLYDANWEMLKWELEPSFARCPYVDSVIARYVEIVAKKASKMPASQRKKASSLLVSEVVKEDWVRLRKKVDAAATCRDNILVNNTTMSGTLFKLWDSIRLYPEESNVGLMLRYLETLMHHHDRVFEEVRYYEDLFVSLFKSHEDPDMSRMLAVVKARRRFRGDPLMVAGLSFDYADREPILLERDYHGYNIVKFGTGFHAFSLDLGPIDAAELTESDIDEYRRHKKYFFGRSNYEVRHLVDGMLYERFERVSVGAGERAEQLNSRLSESQDRISDLEESLAESRKMAEGQRRDISKRDETIVDLRKALDRSLKVAEDLRARIEQRERDMDLLSRSMADKDESMRRFEGDIARFEETVKTLQSTISSREQDIASLRADIDKSCERVKGLEGDIVERNQRVKALSDGIAERDGRVKGLLKEVAAKDKGISRLEGDVDGLKKTVQALRLDISSKKNRISQLEREMASLSRDVESLRSNTTEREKDIESLLIEISNRDWDMSRSNEYISEMEDLASRLKIDLSMQDQTISKLNAEAGVMREYIEDLHRQLVDLKCMKRFRLFREKRKLDVN